MSLFGSLHTGTAGLLAQERATAVISENIANSTTTGYKRQDTAFEELVFNSLYSTSSANGSVASTRLNRIDQQGAVQQTSSATDLAIIGDGFFAVRPVDAAAGDRFLYTRNGTFQENSEGVLTNSAGYALYGWPTDQNGVAAVGETTDSLQLVDIDIFATQSTPTSFGEFSLNLDSDEVPIDPHTIGAGSQLPLNGQEADFTRSIAVYDANGNEQTVSFEFRRTIGPMAHFTSNGAVFDRSSEIIGTNTATPAIAANDILQITDGTDTLDVTFVAAPADASLNQASSVGELLDVVNNFTNAAGTNPYTARLTSDGRFLVQANDPTVTLDITGSSANVLSATGFNFVQDPDGPDYSYEPDVSDLTTGGTTYPGQSDFPAIDNTTTPNPFNWWEVTVTTVDPADPTSGTSVNVAQGLLNFNGDGTLNAVTDPTTGQGLIDLGTLDFDSADAGATVTMTFDIGSITQRSGTYNVLTADQNGAPLGTLESLEIDQDGFVTSVFSNGERVPAYKIPIVDFTNVNGLERISGTAFAETESSGAPAVFDAGTNGVGVFQAAALEGSNVDIANEFSELIVSQRAFGMNSRLITTVDEMTRDLADLKR